MPTLHLNSLYSQELSAAALASWEPAERFNPSEASLRPELALQLTELSVSSMPPEVPDVQPGPTGALSIHERAMSIEFLEHITQMFGLTRCATRAVQTSVIIPHTRVAKTNYAQAMYDGRLSVDLKLSGSCAATSIGRATVFVSHGWDSQWAKLISALRSDHDARKLSAGYPSSCFPCVLAEDLHRG